MPYYDPHIAPAHGSAEATVYLLNEAPGSVESYYQIPSIGDQGGNIYRALRRAKIRWAKDYESILLAEEDSSKLRKSTKKTAGIRTSG